MYYVYILYSTKRKILYKGSTSNLKQRIAEHNSGNVISTKSGRPWKLVHYQAFTNKKDAASEEVFLKSGKGRERLKYLLQNTLTKDS